jgi:hypothetical protein
VLKIVVGEGPKKYVITDANGAVYGSYEEKAEAEEALKGWKEYYGDD